MNAPDSKPLQGVHSKMGIERFLLTAENTAAIQLWPVTESISLVRWKAARGSQFITVTAIGRN